MVKWSSATRTYAAELFSTGTVPFFYYLQPFMFPWIFNSLAEACKAKQASQPASHPANQPASHPPSRPSSQSQQAFIIIIMWHWLTKININIFIILNRLLFSLSFSLNIIIIIVIIIVMIMIVCSIRRRCYCFHCIVMACVLSISFRVCCCSFAKVFDTKRNMKHLLELSQSISIKYTLKIRKRVKKKARICRKWITLIMKLKMCACVYI